MLHYADDLDAKFQQVEAALRDVEDGGWSGYIAPLERFLFRSRPTPEALEQNRTGARKKKESSPADVDVRTSPLSSGTGSGRLLPLFDLCSLPLKE